MDTSRSDDLHVRITELDRQLADANRDVKAHETTEAHLSDALAYAESIVDTVREPLLVLDGEMRIKTANHAFYETFRSPPKRPSGNSFTISAMGNGTYRP